MAEAIWHLLEKTDHVVMSALERLDKLRGKEPYLARIQKATENVRAPQRVIEFDK